MALLKAFVCQIVLLGLYKLFLEQVFEDYLVPDELTRNCLVGFVCLLCFGVQIYLDKAEDDIEEAENPKVKYESREENGAKKSESARISAAYETVGVSASSSVMAPSDKQLRERTCAIPPAQDENIGKTAHSGIFTQFSPNMSDTIPNVTSADCKRHDVPVSNSQKTTTPLMNGFSEPNICEESDEDGIEIDQFVAKESSIVESEQPETDLVEESEQPETDLVEESEQPETNLVGETRPTNIEDAAKKSKESVPIEAEEIEAIKTENLSEVVLETECLANGDDFSSRLDSGEITALKVDQSSEVQMTIGTNDEPLNHNNGSSEMVQESESKTSIKDNSGNGNEINLSSEQNACTKDITESQEINNTSLHSPNEVNGVDNINKNTETSTLVKTAISLQSEKLLASTGRQKTVSDVCVAPVTIDISFIYACH